MKKFSLLSFRQTKLIVSKVLGGLITQKADMKSFAFIKTPFDLNTTFNCPHQDSCSAEVVMKSSGAQRLSGAEDIKVEQSCKRAFVKISQSQRRSLLATRKPSFPALEWRLVSSGVQNSNVISIQFWQRFALGKTNDHFPTIYTDGSWGQKFLCCFCTSTISIHCQLKNGLLTPHFSCQTNQNHTQFRNNSECLSFQFLVS